MTPACPVVQAEHTEKKGRDKPKGTEKKGREKKGRVPDGFDTDDWEEL
jgi:hypothetical protein